MGRPHPVELRKRADARIEQGHAHTETARRLCVPIEFASDLGRLERETGALVTVP